MNNLKKKGKPFFFKLFQYRVRKEVNKVVKGKLKVWLLLLPVNIIMLLFVFNPIIKTFVFSLKKYKLTEPNNVKFIGLENYINIFKSEEFYYSLSNSFFILIVVLVISFLGSLIVGLILNRKSKISSLLMGIAIIPWALPPVVNGIIWNFIFYPGFGLANKILINLSIIDIPIDWMVNRFAVLVIVSVVVSWRVIPFCAIIILANLQSIDKNLYEAAMIDGASKIQQFFKISFPLLIPSLIIVFVNITMSAINVFDEIIALSGYRTESETLLIYNYLNTFSFLDFGYGSAITYVIMILSGLFGYGYIKFLTKERFL